MESTTKTKLTKEELQRLVLEQFGCGLKDYREFGEGHMNTIYHITLERPFVPSSVPGEERESVQEVILKVSYFPEKEILTYEREIMRSEVFVYQLLRGKKIPTPEVLGYDFSHTLLEADYFFMTSVPGVSWESVKEELTEEEKEGLMRELGNYQAILHSVDGRAFGYYKEDKCGFATWAEAFSSMIQDMIEDGRVRKVPLPYEEIRSAVLKRKELLNEIRTPKLVDFDLWAGNVLLDKKDGNWYISAIIDFERAFFGDPFADFIAAVNLYTDIGEETQFIEGYRIVEEKFQVTEHDRERMKLYSLYLNMIMAIEAYRYEEGYRRMIQGYCSRNIDKRLEELS